MIEIIPAIDLIEGKCVRLQKGDYSLKTIYNEDPLEVAKMFEDSGLKRLHLVDLDGAKASHVVNSKVLEKIASKTKLIIDFGGGIKSDDDIKIVFECGADMATIGSVAVTKKELFVSWIKKYGTEKIVLSADVNDKKIAISGWLDKTDIELFDFLKEYEKLAVKNVLCTDISKDGMLQGTAMELYKEMKKEFNNLFIIASGGITEMKEVIELDKLNIGGVIIGKAIYEGKITLKQLSDLNK